MRPSRLAIVALLCLVGLTGIAAVAGAPPPTQLCGVCSIEATDRAGIDGATGSGTLDIYVDERGDSLWRARVPVDSSAAKRYRANESALEAAVDDAWAPYHAAEGDVSAVESTLEEETVVVEYAVDDVARPGIGDAWIVDYFAVGTSNARYGRTAERVTIHAPEGTGITNRVPDAAVDGNTATWTDDAEFGGQTYVTYGSGGVLGTAAGYATIGLETGPTALEHGVRGGVALSLLVGFVGVTIGRTDLGIAAFDAAMLERLIAAVGAVGAAGFLVVGVAATDAGLAPGAVALASLGVGYALLGSGARRLGRRLETRGLVGLSLLATVVAGGVALLLAGPPVYAVPFCFGAATALCLPIGYTAERGRFPVALVAVAALAPIAAIASVAPVSVFGYGPALYGLFLLPWVAAVAVFGYPLALLGRRLALGVD
ncbi:hypothetical protein Htur_1171 [Haloterrigena turkmenica DSM 5511]|uniref:Uncharacterized protein n=1 Tax=Haloterrigena turkmenica (strain ATCC 51198 / DSM 5511 / JCM 9101 / NCIMB 13204 / VKM B-1734 / 4k) TaxID=543526 RepID=D2RZD9_HALTV|nr:hypothetical protein [Haloterrigena turkmenica]ADB60063.1 hypothetical protein Htur_1171 [Haloterrigena turkmenica DSM 5511]